jgi:spermidine/putrescine transport system substrate-binding protein
VAAKNAEYTRYATPNAMAMQHLDEALKADKSIYLPENLLNRCETVLEAGKLTFLYDQLWTELKCS